MWYNKNAKQFGEEWIYIKIQYCYGADEHPLEVQLPPDEKICCFTGHRPENMPKENTDEYVLLRQLTKLYIRLMLDRGRNIFITGMSRGFDLMAAELILKDEDLMPVAKVICAIPYLAQINEMKTQKEIELYKYIYENSSAAFCMYKEFKKKCYAVRNQFMVKHSNAVIAYLKNPEIAHSGTIQTLNIAKKRGLETIVITQEDLISETENTLLEIQ